MSGDQTTSQVVNALLIQAHYPEVWSPQNPGSLRWLGPGPLLVPPRGEVYANCRKESEEPMQKDIFVVESTADDQLPAGLFIPSVLLTLSTVDEKVFRLPVLNEASKEVAVQPGTVLAHLFSTDTVTEPCIEKTVAKKIDSSRFNFGTSSIP